MASLFRLGSRCLVSRVWSHTLFEVEIAEISPSGDRVKFEPGGWENTSQWWLIEELEPKENPWARKRVPNETC